MNKTLIEWVQNPDGTPGYTWNPITGCNNQIDGMCQGGNFPCYAYRLANGRLRNLYLANKHTATLNYDEDSYPFYPRFWPERMSGQLSSRKPKGIFVCDMSDLFGVGIPDNWTWQVLQLIKAYPQHRFYLLTKQPQNLPKWSPFPDNCWLGVTATGFAMSQRALSLLSRIEAKIKFLSYEPLLENITLWPISNTEVDWLIIGAQTKPTVYPRIEWVQEIVKASKQAGIPYFLKNNLAPMLPDDKLYWRIGYENGHFTDAKPRQEMPH